MLLIFDCFTFLAQVVFKFFSPNYISYAVLSHSVVSDSLRPHGLYNLAGFSLHGHSPGKNIRVGCHDLPQGIFPTQGSNPGLPHCRQSLHHLSHQGSPRILEWVSPALLQGNLPDPGIQLGSHVLQAESLQLSYQGSPSVS